MNDIRERLRWDSGIGEIRDGEVRYLLIRPDTLMGMFAGLPPAAQAEALAALAQSTATHGAKSAQRYHTLGAADAVALLATIERTAPLLGWGAWRLGRESDGGLNLEVRNSPFAAGYGPGAATPVCAPIAGMLRAVAELVSGRPARVEETACAALGAPACRFRTTSKLYDCGATPTR